MERASTSVHILTTQSLSALQVSVIYRAPNCLGVAPLKTGHLPSLLMRVSLTANADYHCVVDNHFVGMWLRCSILPVTPTRASVTTPSPWKHMAHRQRDTQTLSGETNREHTDRLPEKPFKRIENKRTDRSSCDWTQVESWAISHTCASSNPSLLCMIYL